MNKSETGKYQIKSETGKYIFDELSGYNSAQAKCL